VTVRHYYDHKPEKPDRDAKTVPGNIERHVFREARLATDAGFPQRIF